MTALSACKHRGQCYLKACALVIHADLSRAVASHAHCATPLQKFYVPAGLPLNRYYFLFGKPIKTSRDIAKDRDRVAELYADTKRALEDCITYLLEQRENDPFRNPLRRLLWERRERRQAPTFVPPPDVRL